MYITNVIPLAHIPRPLSQTLSYFTSYKLKKGALVYITLKRKKVPAIIESQNQARLKKLEIKEAHYKLKPISEIITKKPLLSPFQIEFAKWISLYYWSSLSKSLGLFLSSSSLKKIIKHKTSQEHFPFAQPVAYNSFLKETASNYSKELRIVPRNFIPEKEIKSKIKEEGQILILAPEKSKAHYFEKHCKNLGETIFFSKTQSSKKYLQNLEKIKQSQAKIIVGTRSSLFAPFSNLKLIVVCEEESKNHKSEKEPRINAREISEKLAEALGIKIILLSSFPSTNTYYSFKESGNIPSKKLPSISAKKEIVDMKKLEKWQPISPHLFKKIEENLSSPSSKIILYLNRKGDSTSVVCQDCNNTLKCENCDTPLVYHNNLNLMICHHCGFKQKPPQECPYCKSWRLILLGLGIEKIERTLKKQFPRQKILRLDKETSPKKVQQKSIIKSFSEEANILIATSLIFQSFNLPQVNLVGIVSLDSLLSLPDFRAEEEALRTIHKLSALSSNEVVLQTLWPDAKIFNWIDKKYSFALNKFIKERETFLYPPFSQLIKLEYAHKSKKVAEKESKILKNELEKRIQNLNITTFAAPKYSAKASQKPGKVSVQILGPAPGFIPKLKGGYIYKILIKLPKLESKLYSLKIKKYLLQAVPPSWKTDVNPVTNL